MHERIRGVVSHHPAPHHVVNSIWSVCCWSLPTALCRSWPACTWDSPLCLEGREQDSHSSRKRSTGPAHGTRDGSNRCCSPSAPRRGEAKLDESSLDGMGAFRAAASAHGCARQRWASD